MSVGLGCIPLTDVMVGSGLIPLTFFLRLQVLVQGRITTGEYLVSMSLFQVSNTGEYLMSTSLSQISSKLRQRAASCRHQIFNLILFIIIFIFID